LQIEDRLPVRLQDRAVSRIRLDAVCDICSVIAHRDGHPNMKYADGSSIALNDLVTVPVPGGSARARVVMLGESYEHASIDPQFLRWVYGERKLEKTAVVVEWIDCNPFAHDDPTFAQVGNYLFSPVDEFLRPIRETAG
jgi:hypothetical protein